MWRGRDLESDEDTDERDGGKGRKSARVRYEQSNTVDYDKFEEHSVFKQARVSASVLQGDDNGLGTPRIPINLIAYDGLGRLFVWNSADKQLHYVELHRASTLNDFENAAGSLLASKDFKTIQLSLPVDFQVVHLMFNRTGRSLVLAGEGALMAVNMVVGISASSTGICRTRKIGAQRIYGRGSRDWLRILQIQWHPYSDTHLGILSSDGAFRLFNLSLDTESAEQEYHLQQGSSGLLGAAPSARAIAFSFGGEHLWDHFTVFFLFSDGSIYALCPVLPFGSMFNGTVIDELSKDVAQWEFLSNRPDIGTFETASFALTWLEAAFPEFGSFGEKEQSQAASVLKARAHISLEASLVLQAFGSLAIAKSEKRRGGKTTFQVLLLL